MIKETEIYYKNGVDAVWVENYFGDVEKSVASVMYVKAAPFKVVGVLL